MHSPISRGKMLTNTWNQPIMSLAPAFSTNLPPLSQGRKKKRVKNTHISYFTYQEIVLYSFLHLSIPAAEPEADTLLHQTFAIAFAVLLYGLIRVASLVD